MIEIALMIEGQDGLTWPRWQKLAAAAESLGFAGLYRSDHFTNAGPPDRDSLELWTSLTWLASSTRRIEFGPLVSPVSFRHPALTARMASAVDDLSHGRLHLGMGAGWQQREHEHFGFDLLDIRERFARFEEGLQVVTRLLTSDTPVDFNGRYYRLKDALLLPRPRREAGPPIVIGGNGAKKTLPLAARYASEWNGVYLTPGQFAALSRRLSEMLEAAGRAPSSVKRSLMHGCFFGKDDAALRRRLGDRSREKLSERGVVAGTPGEVVDQLMSFAEAGVQRIMLQWLEMDDLDGLEGLGSSVLPQVMK